MFKKQQRLTSKAFDQSFKLGKRFHSPLIQLIYDVTSSDFHGAAVVGKKVFKKAVDRNRLRRQIYGLIYRRHNNSSLSGTYILIAKPAAAKSSRQEIKSAVEKLLQQTRT